jgi:hypothetical protein
MTNNLLRLQLLYLNREATCTPLGSHWSFLIKSLILYGEHMLMFMFISRNCQRRPFHLFFRIIHIITFLTWCIFFQVTDRGGSRIWVPQPLPCGNWWEKLKPPVESLCFISFLLSSLPSLFSFCVCLCHEWNIHVTKISHNHEML